MGTSTLHFTRANWGRSHMRSMLRLEMLPLMVEERQLSKVQLPQGWGRGPVALAAFSTASSWVRGALQLAQVQVQALAQAQVQALAQAKVVWQAKVYCFSELTHLMVYYYR